MRYVCGLVFNKSKRDMLFVRKINPEWQFGYLNGVSGKIEENDTSPVDAMVREFVEETGVSTFSPDWEHILTMNVEGNIVYFFKTYLDDLELVKLDGKRNDIGELLAVCRIALIDNITCIFNLQWIIPLALSPMEFPIKCTELVKGGFDN